MKRIWDIYRKKIIHRVMVDQEEERRNISYYRDLLFVHSLVVFGPLATLAFIPGFALSISEGYWSIAIVDTIAYLMVILAVFYGKMGLLTRKILFISAVYFAAIFLTFLLGVKGPGFLYLLAVSVWAGISLGNFAGYFTAILNFFIYLSFIFILIFLDAEIAFLKQYEPIDWFAVGINLVILNFALVASIEHLFNRLQDRLNREKSLQESLGKQIKLAEFARNKAEESDRLKTAFLANMSHEIRTPMNAIVGFSDLLAGHETKLKQRKKYAEIISQNSQVLLSIIEGIIELPKIDSKLLKLHIEKVEVKSFMADFLKSSQENCPPGLEIYTEIIVPESKSHLWTDPVKLKQVLNNLITNSFQYSQKGKITVNLTFHDESYVFEITDEGIGIPHDQQEKVFARFYQIDPQSPGVGLGLSIVKSMVSLMGGHVKMRSTPGKGSSFSLIFPEFVFRKEYRDGANPASGEKEKPPADETSYSLS